MKVSFCATVSDVTPIVISFNLPETSKPIQDANFERPRVHSIVAFDKRISEVVNGEMLQLPKRTVVEIQVIWITYTINHHFKQTESWSLPNIFVYLDDIWFVQPKFSGNERER